MTRRLLQAVVNLHKSIQCRRYRRKSQLNISKDLSDFRLLSKVNYTVDSFETQQKPKFLKNHKKRVSYSGNIQSVSQDNYAYNLEDPLYIEVEQRRKVWKDVIDRYKTQLDEKKGVGRKAAKRKKSKKKGKEAQNKKQKEVLETIQMLPIWVVKKIFGYLDTRILRKLSVVSKYWNYVIEELLKEKASRRTLNKAISKMEATSHEEKPSAILPSTIESPKGLSSFDRCKLKASVGGTTRKKVTIPIKFPFFNGSVVGTTEKVTTPFSHSPFENLQGFPRNVATFSKMFKLQVCKYTTDRNNCVDDVNFTKEAITLLQNQSSDDLIKISSDMVAPLLADAETVQIFQNSEFVDHFTEEE